MKYRNNILLMFFLLSALHVNTAGAQDKVLPEQAVISVASERDYPPFCVVNDQGEADGFSVDLFKAAATAMGLQVKFKVDAWQKIKAELAEGKIDALPLVGRSSEREKIYYFTFPYHTLHGAVFVRKGTTGINTLSDLQSRAIIVMAGDNAEEYVRRKNLSSRIIVTDNYVTAFELLRSGKHDAVIAQRLMGLQLLNKLGIDNIMPLAIQLNDFKQDFSFAVKKGNHNLLAKLNEGLAIIIADGTYRELYKKWFTPEPLQVSFIEKFKIAIYIFIPLVIMISFIAILILRTEVKRQTAKLRQEITDHQQADEALIASERRFYMLMQQSPAVIEIYAIDGLQIAANEAYAELWGFPVSRTVNKFNVLKSKEVKASGLLKYVIRAYNGETVSVPEYEFDPTGATEAQGRGRVRWLSTKIYPLKDHSGTVDNIVITHEDITQRMQTEEALKQHREHLEELVHERTADFEKSQQALTYLMEDVNESREELSLSNTKLETQADALQRQNVELEIKHKELEDSNRFKSEFLSNMSHELRTPLNSIMALSQALIIQVKDKINDEESNYLKIIEHNGQHLLQLINGILDLAKIEAGKMDVTPTETSAASVLDILKESLDPLAKEQGVTLNLQIPDKMPRIKTDAIKLHQVLLNLVGNAIKFSEGGSVNVSLKYDSDNVYFEVKDTGIGISEDYLEHIFDEFKQVDGSSSRKYGGTGLGLSIADEMIKLLGGTIGVKSKLGKGSIFTVTLPIKWQDKAINSK
jgi:PAS domain S-box-containing protein